jgi:hypothetical protein
MFMNSASQVKAHASLPKGFLTARARAGEPAAEQPPPGLHALSSRASVQAVQTPVVVLTPHLKHADHQAASVDTAVAGIW